MTDPAQWRTQIEAALHPERNGLLIKRGVTEGASHEHLVVESLLALLAAVQAETDRNSRIDELKRIQEVTGIDTSRGKKFCYYSYDYYTSRLAALNQKAG